MFQFFEKLSLRCYNSFCSWFPPPGMEEAAGLAPEETLVDEAPPVDDGN